MYVAGIETDVALKLYGKGETERSAMIAASNQITLLYAVTSQRNRKARLAVYPSHIWNDISLSKGKIIQDYTDNEQHYQYELTVEATQADIDNGQARECSTCPLALALKRYFPLATVSVMPKQVLLYFTEENTEFYLKHSVAACEFIQAIDYDMSVTPTSVSFFFSQE